MRRFLLAWEFGGDLGHVRRQLAIARGLRARGHEILLAFCDLRALGAECPEGIDWVAAPRLPLSADVALAPLNASDILLSLGFDDPEAVAGALTGWAGLLRTWKPDAIVADHAPGALLASRLAAIPRFTVGSGFSAPPRGDPMPALRSWIATDAGLLAQRDARLVAAVRAACERLQGKQRAPAKASELFEADGQLLCCWPELDPFGPRDGVEYLGPQGDGRTVRAEWTGTARPRLFAYLKPRDTRFPALLEALRRVAAEAIVAAPGLAPGEAEALSRDGMRVIAQPVDLHAALSEADLALGHSGAGLVAAATACGVPMALLPMQLEQYLIGRRVCDAGHAEMVSPEGAQPEFEPWLRAILARQDLRAAAARARAVGTRPPADAALRLERLVEG